MARRAIRKVVAMNIGISTYDVPITEFLAMVGAGEQAGF